MQNLPTAETYQKEALYMPWGILLSKIEEYVVKNVPENGAVLDLLCGTGLLMRDIQKKRPDIKFVGVDMEKEYIDYAKTINHKIELLVADAFTWESDRKFDAVLCTGGLHHIQHEKQREFIQKISTIIDSDGFAIIGDPYINDYSSEQERKLAAAKLGYEYLVATISSGATDDVIEAAVTLIENDIFFVEYKNSINKIEPDMKEFFTTVEKHKTWPRKETEYGDYYFILKK